MHPRIILSSLLAAALVLLQACAQTPPQEAPAKAEKAPEISLNLPTAPHCDCSASPTHDYTFLDRGFDSLVAGDYDEALQYFERYQRLEDSPESQWEAGVSIAYIKSLRDAKLYDPGASRSSFDSLNRQPWQSMDVHPRALLLRQSLQNTLALQRRVDTLEVENGSLKEDLAKREETIKRLRELTLGQKAGAP